MLKKELGDILWFVAGIARNYYWNLEDIAQMNLNKLEDRKNRNVIQGSGDNR
jgi:NTP pyrophosphatase (non-canonical NTP hydrolase)